jgi:hypothetical protein
MLLVAGGRVMRSVGGCIDALPGIATTSAAPARASHSSSAGYSSHQLRCRPERDRSSYDSEKGCPLSICTNSAVMRKKRGIRCICCALSSHRLRRDTDAPISRVGRPSPEAVEMKKLLFFGGAGKAEWRSAVFSVWLIHL